MDIGTIKTISLEDGRLECVVDFGADDVDPLVIVYNGANRSEYPLPGDEVVVDRDGAESVIVAVFRDNPDSVGIGESIIYGRDGSGDMVSSVKLCSDGKVLINGGGRSVAAYPDLKTAFDTLKNDFNAFLNTKYNLHTHLVAALPSVGAPPPTIPTLVTTSTGSPSTANIDPSESNTVEVP